MLTARAGAPIGGGGEGKDKRSERWRRMEAAEAARMRRRPARRARSPIAVIAASSAARSPPSVFGRLGPRSLRLGDARDELFFGRALGEELEELGALAEVRDRRERGQVAPRVGGEYEEEHGHRLAVEGVVGDRRLEEEDRHPLRVL